MVRDDEGNGNRRGYYTRAKRRTPTIEAYWKRVLNEEATTWTDGCRPEGPALFKFKSVRVRSFFLFFERFRRVVCMQFSLFETRARTKAWTENASHLLVCCSFDGLAVVLKCSFVRTKERVNRGSVEFKAKESLELDEQKILGQSLHSTVRSAGLARTTLLLLGHKNMSSLYGIERKRPPTQRLFFGPDYTPRTGFSNRRGRVPRRKSCWFFFWTRVRVPPIQPVRVRGRRDGYRTPVLVPRGLVPPTNVSVTKTK